MKYLLLCTLLCAAVYTSAQTAPLAFDKKSEKLTEAIGWSFLFGKTVDNKNQISHSKETSMNPHSTNFYWMQDNILIYKAKKYHVIVYEFLGGDYDYPLTQQGFRETHEVTFWMLDDAEYAQLKSVVDKKEGKHQQTISS